MEDERILLEQLRTDLAELTALHGPPGAEQPVIARLRDAFMPLSDQVSLDHMGNLAATIGADGSGPRLVVAAHADEIGAVVAAVEPDGFLRLQPLGGAQARLLEGRAAWVNGHPGVIGARSGHLIPADEQGRATRFSDLFIDLGVESATDVAVLGIQIGDPVVVLSELQSLAGTRVAGKAIDNRAGCAVLLNLLRRLHGRPLPCRLTLLVTVQEEVGLRGAMAAFARLQPDLALVLDTAPAGGTPDTRGQAYSARIGQGVLLQIVSSGSRAGFIMPRATRDFLRQAAARCGVQCQSTVLSGGVTDAAAAHLAAGGIPTLQITIARRYSHSPVEVLDLRDLAAMLVLAEEVITHPPSAEDLAFLHSVST